MFKKSLLSVACFAALLGVAVPASASTFHLVVPLNARPAAPGPGTETPPPVPEPEITVSLNAAALPKATISQAYSESLRPYLSVTGDAAFDPTDARWSLAGGALPAGLALDNVTGQVAGTPSASVESTASFNVAVTYKGKSAQQTYTLPVVKQPTGCYAYLQANPGAASGWYTFDPDGAGPGVAQSYYCDMTSDGGGWTRIVRQTEAEPVTNWNGGVNGNSYSLATDKIPQHTQIAFGKDEQATAVDYVNGTYHSGEIPLVRLLSPKTGFNYDLVRLHDGFASFGDPEHLMYTAVTSDNPYGDGDWRNGLTFDRTGGRNFSWTFFPQQQNAISRGYAMNGSALYPTSESYAWTVWVR